MGNIPAQCEGCNYNGTKPSVPSEPAAPIIPNINYDFDLDSNAIPENLLEFFIEALLKQGLSTTIVNPLKGKLKRFFDAHRGGDYTVGSLLLAFCLIVESFAKYRETKDYKVISCHIMRDHLERSGYACGGSVAVDVFFMEVI